MGSTADKMCMEVMGLRTDAWPNFRFFDERHPLLSALKFVQANHALLTYHIAKAATNLLTEITTPLSHPLPLPTHP
jgi:hypothetical protein